MKKRVLSSILALLLLMTSIFSLSIPAHAGENENVSQSEADIPSADDYGFEMVKLIDNGPDEDNVVVTIMADGFTASEQGAFITAAEKTVDYMFKKYPYSVMKDRVNVYAIKVISNQSGAKMDPAKSKVNVDNYFGSTFFYDGVTERMLYINEITKATNVLNAYTPNADMKIIMINSTTHGGGGGDFATLSCASTSNELMVHELAHSFANLADEYWAGDYFALEKPNLTKETDPNLVKWKTWIGIEGVDIHKYPYQEQGTPSNAIVRLWRRPHKECLMYAFKYTKFCQVCCNAMIQMMASYTKESYFADDLSSKLSLKPGSARVIDGAFSGCENLTSMTLPSTIKTIGRYAFLKCTSLTSITSWAATPPTIDSTSFYELDPKNITVYVPKGTKATYAGANYWKDFKEIIELDVNLSLESLTSNGTQIALGETVTWTTSTIGGSGNYQYKFELFKGGVLQTGIANTGAYGSASTFKYTPTTAGEYTLKAYVKTTSDAEVSLESSAITVLASGVLPERLFYFPFNSYSEMTKYEPFGVKSTGYQAKFSNGTGVNGSGSLHLKGGIGSYIHINGDQLDYTKPFTVSMWIKPDSVASKQFLFTCHPGDDWLMIRAGGKLGSYGIGHGDKTFDNITFKAGEWTHLAVTVTSPKVTYYINGNQAAQVDYSGTYGGGTANFFSLGAKFDTISDINCFKGHMDEISLYSKALSSKEIENLYESPSVNEGSSSSEAPSSSSPVVPSSSELPSSSSPVVPSSSELPSSSSPVVPSSSELPSSSSPVVPSSSELPSSSSPVVPSSSSSVIPSSNLPSSSNTPASSDTNTSEQSLPEPPKVIIMRLNACQALLDGAEIAVDQTNKEVAPFTLNGKTMVPVRFVENLDADVKYNGATAPVTVTYGDIKLTLEFGKDTMTKVVGDGQPETIDLPTAPSLVEGKTCVPIREIAEEIGFQVKYDKSTHVIVVSTSQLSDDDLKTNINMGKESLPYFVVGVKDISSNKTEYSVKVGGSLQLEKSDITFKPEKVGCNKLIYSIDNESVATVSSNGRIKALSKGTAKITIASHNGKKVVVTVTVL